MTADFDFYGDDFQRNPGGTFARMIRECPIHRSEEHGWYSVFRYRDIADILRDNQTFSQGLVQALPMHNPVVARYW